MLFLLPLASFQLSRRRTYIFPKTLRRATFRAALAPVMSSFTGRRLMHDVQKIASLSMVDNRGSVVTREIGVTVKDPDEAFVMLAKSEGFAIQRAIDRQIGLSLAANPKKVPLIFYHNNRHFAHRGFFLCPISQHLLPKLTLCFQRKTLCLIHAFRWIRIFRARLQQMQVLRHRGHLESRIALR